jgi:hypothetical protein
VKAPAGATDVKMFIPSVAPPGALLTLTGLPGAAPLRGSPPAIGCRRSAAHSCYFTASRTRCTWRLQNPTSSRGLPSNARSHRLFNPTPLQAGLALPLRGICDAATRYRRSAAHLPIISQLLTAGPTHSRPFGPGLGQQTVGYPHERRRILPVRRRPERTTLAGRPVGRCELKARASTDGGTVPGARTSSGPMATAAVR